MNTTRLMHLHQQVSHRHYCKTPQTEKELKKLIRDEYRAKLEVLDQKQRAELKREMAIDYSRSERYIREVTSRIDKDLKVELRDKAFDMWMACYSQQEIATEVGYSERSVREFLNSIQNRENGTDANSPVSSENPQLTETAIGREFDEEEDDSNSLGVYKLDQRLLIKANHLLELAIEGNATHGLQLSQEDKQNMARRIYHVTPERERDDKKRQLAKILSV